jgi:hypothetical protein
MQWRFIQQVKKYSACEDLECRYRVHKISPLDHVLKQFNRPSRLRILDGFVAGMAHWLWAKDAAGGNLQNYVLVV